jgi:DNA repair protein RadC
MLYLREMPPGQAPRERLERYGAEALSDVDLMAVLLAKGAKGLPVTGLAVQVLRECGGLKGLMRQSFSRLLKFKGLGRVKVCQICAVAEIAKRITTGGPEVLRVVTKPEDAAGLLLSRFSFQSKENFGILILDTKNQVKKEKVISIGSLNASIVHPREIFFEAIMESAASLILFHNHPSGDPTPSREDISLTRRLAKAGKLMGIDILDHLVIGQNNYASFKSLDLL